MSMEHRKLLARHRLIDSALNVTVAAINALLLITGKACINEAIHVLLMHGFCTLHIPILGRQKS